LSLLPPEAIPDAVVEIQDEIDSDSTHITNLRKLISYIQRQWVTKRSVGPSRLSVRDNRSRTNNVLESYHATLRRRIKVSHPNLYAFLGHLQNTTVDNMSDVARVRNGLQIRRPKIKANLLNESRIRHVCQDLTTALTAGFSSCVLSATPSQRTPSHYNPIQMMTARTKTRIRCRRQRLLAACPQRRSHQRQMTQCRNHGAVKFV